MHTCGITRILRRVWNRIIVHNFGWRIIGRRVCRCRRGIRWPSGRICGCSGWIGSNRGRRGIKACRGRAVGRRVVNRVGTVAVGTPGTPADAHDDHNEDDEHAQGEGYLKCLPVDASVLAIVRRWCVVVDQTRHSIIWKLFTFSIQSGIYAKIYQSPFFLFSFLFYLFVRTRVRICILGARKAFRSSKFRSIGIHGTWKALLKSCCVSKITSRTIIAIYPRPKNI